MMRKPSTWIAVAAGLVCLVAVGTASHAQQTIRVGWTIPAEESKYWMMRRPAEFPESRQDLQYRVDPVPGHRADDAGAGGGRARLRDAGAAVARQRRGWRQLKAYIVAQHVFEKPGGFSVYWAVKDDSPIKTIADLKGKTVGISVIGGGTQGPFNMLLKQNGVDPTKDIKLVEVGFRCFRGCPASGPRRCRQHEPAFCGARRSQGRHAQAVLAVRRRCRTSSTFWRPAAPILSTKIRNW